MKKAAFLVLVFMLVSMSCNFPSRISATQQVVVDQPEVDTLMPTLTPTQEIIPTFTQTLIPTDEPTETPVPTQTKNLVVTRVFVPGVLDSVVVQQPDSDAGWISYVEGEITEYSGSYNKGNIILLAHNRLAGRDFINFKEGDDVLVFFDDNTQGYFKIKRLYAYQQLNPTEGKFVTSDLLDLRTGRKYSWEDVSRLIYEGNYHVVFQTCIERDGNSIWGLAFYIAEPVK